MPNLTPEQRYILQMIGNDADAGIFNDPEYKFRNMRTPNSVVDPKTGEYLGEYEMMPQSLLGADPANLTTQQLRNLDATMSNLDAARLADIEQNIANSGNQIIDQSRLNLGALLRRLGMQ